MRRATVFVYGVICYAIFLATFVYAIGFVGNVGVPKSMDSARTTGLAAALLVDLSLLAVFALQHSVMARPSFKRWWTTIVPAPAERSTYTLLSSLALILLFWQWRPLGGTIWNVVHPLAQTALYSLFAFGWILILLSTFLINHFDLFGLRQIWLYLRKRPYVPLKFQTPGPYKVVRHPLYLGWVCAFWATPTMTTTHLVFALGTTAYILMAIRLEEHDLIGSHPEYASYRMRVPMLVPRMRSRKATRATAPVEAG